MIRWLDIPQSPVKAALNTIFYSTSTTTTHHYRDCHHSHSPGPVAGPVVSLTLPQHNDNDVHLNDLLQTHQSMNEYASCPTCKQWGPFRTSTSTSSKSSLLMITLNRLTWQHHSLYSRYNKCPLIIPHHIRIPEHAPTTENPHPPTNIYDLTAQVNYVHRITHYTATIADPSTPNQWWECNDAVISPTAPPQKQNGTATILTFQRRRNSRTHNPLHRAATHDAPVDLTGDDRRSGKRRQHH
jgi:hypothetical protein